MDPNAISVEAQVQALLRGATPLLSVMRLGTEMNAVVRTRILTQPLKRANDTDPLLQANEPTPQCFDAVIPYWLRPSISIAGGAPMGRIGGLGLYGGDVRGSRYMVVRYTLAFYAAPDVADVKLWQMRSACMNALNGKKVIFPDGMGAHLRPIGDISTPVNVPEFPGAGKQVIERISAFGIGRRT